MAKIKHDTIDLAKLETSANLSNKIGESTTDDSLYNVLTRESHMLESSDFESDLKAIFESSKVISGPIHIEVNSLEDEVNNAFAMLEAEEDVVTEKEVTEEPKEEGYEHLKGKKVILKNASGKEMPAMVVDVVDGNVKLQGLQGGEVDLSDEAFKKSFVREDAPVEDKVESTETLEEIPSTDKQPTEPTEELKKETIVENTENLVKASSPVKDEKETTVNPSGHLTNPGVLDFTKAPVVEQGEFVKNALAAKEAAKKKTAANAVKPLQKTLEVKLLQHSDKYKDFVNSFKDEKNGALIECVLEAFELYVNHAKAKLEAAKPKISTKALCEGMGANVTTALMLMLAGLGFSQEQATAKVSATPPEKQEEMLQMITTKLKGIPSVEDLKNQLEQTGEHADVDLEEHLKNQNAIPEQDNISTMSVGG